MNSRTTAGPGYRTVRVFISSTFRDMQAERDHLVRFVFPRLREELLPRRIHLVDVDLRWGVTSEQDALEACREVIDECRPRFLCVLGGRYGWVPPGTTRSITADEVHHSVLDRDPAERGSAFFYFRDPAATAAAAEAEPGEFREPEGSAGERALEELKSAIVGTSVKPFIYPARWDDDAHRIAGLAAFGDRVHDDVMRSIVDELGETEPKAPGELAADDAAMAAFGSERSERFVLGSRDTVLDVLLRHAGGTEGNGYLCVTGAPGSGKSALLAHLSRRLGQAAVPATLLISHYVGATVSSTDVRRTLRRLCQELVAGAGITADIPHDPRDLLGAFARILQQACERKRVVILLDAVNEMDASPSFVGLSWLPEVLPVNARLVLSTVPGPTLDELRRRREPPSEVALETLTRADGEAIIEEFLHLYRKRMTVGQREALLAKTDAGTPLYLVTALEELRTLGTYEEITARISQLPPGTQGLFAWILARLEDDDGFRDALGRRVGRTLVSGFAALLGVSRKGLSQQELAQLLAAGHRPEEGAIADDADGNVAALLRLLRPYLMHRGALLDFYHAQLRRSVAEEYLDPGSERQAAHRRLAEYFLGQAWSVTDGSWTGPMPRGFSELLFHLREAGMWEALVACIRDPGIFAHLPPGEYGVDYDGGVYTGGAPDALAPDRLSVLPVELRSRIAYGIAAALAEQARGRIRQTRAFARPWPETARYLRENDPEGFAVYRDTFYSFTRLAGKAAEYAIAAFEASENGRGTLAVFSDENGDVGSFLHYLHNFGHEETGLSHALEDDAYPSYRVWERLGRIAAPPAG